MVALPYFWRAFPAKSIELNFKKLAYLRLETSLLNASVLEHARPGRWFRGLRGLRTM